MAQPEVRDRIITAATTLFAQKGYGSTSVREVVQAAGVTKPTLYYWFENKEALFLEVVNTHIVALGQIIEQIASSAGSVTTRLSAFATQYPKRALESREVIRLLMTAQHPTEGQPQVDLMSGHLLQVQMLEALVREGIANGELRSDLVSGPAVLGFIGGLNMYITACIEGMDLPDDTPSHLLDLFFRGAAA